MMSETKTLPLAYVIEQYASPNTFVNWDKWLKTTDKEILDHVQRLIDDKGSNPYFDEPIILIEDETDEDGDFYPAHVANGMHRILATHLSGQEDIYVQYGYGNAEDEEDLTIVAYFSRDEIENEDILYDTEDMLWERLSFRHEGSRNKEWVEPSFGSYSNKVTRIHLYCQNTKNIDPKEMFNQINNITITVPYYSLIGVSIEDWTKDDIEYLKSYGNVPKE